MWQRAFKHHTEFHQEKSINQKTIYTISLSEISPARCDGYYSRRGARLLLSYQYVSLHIYYISPYVARVLENNGLPFSPPRRTTVAIVIGPSRVIYISTCRVYNTRIASWIVSFVYEWLCVGVAAVIVFGSLNWRFFVCKCSSNSGNVDFSFYKMEFINRNRIEL